MANIEKIRQEMLKEGLPALWLYDEVDRLYATGFHTSDGAVLILPDKAYFITDSRYIEAAEKQVQGAEVLLCTSDNKESAILKRILGENGLTSLAVQEGSLSYADYIRLQESLGVTFLAGQKITGSLREIKERYEVENMVTAQRIAEKALDHVLGLIAPGMTELQLAAELEYQMKKNGAESLSFETICVAGANSSLPHGVPSDYKLRKGDFVTMDFGCKYKGYCSDMTRTVAVGSVSDEMRRVYETVLAAQEAGEAACRPGVIGKNMDMAARRVIEDAGYGKYFGHGLGHSVGLLIHEAPNANPTGDRPLPAGTVVTNEPGIYLPGKFGVRIEDMLYITEDGCENLTKAPRNLIIV